MSSFWNGFEKQALFGFGAHDKTVDQIHQHLGDSYKKEHIGSYVKNLQLHKVKNPDYKSMSTDVKNLYDKKSHYEKLQDGLRATKEGSPEEKAYLGKHKKHLDKGVLDWTSGNVEMATKYNSSTAKLLSQIHEHMTGLTKQAGAITKFIGSVTGVRDVVRGYKAIDKLHRAGKITGAGAITGSARAQKIKDLSGTAIAGGLGRMGLTGAGVAYATRKKEPQQEGGYHG